jgi:hypothetical protein
MEGEAGLDSAGLAIFRAIGIAAEKKKKKKKKRR